MKRLCMKRLRDILIIITCCALLYASAMIYEIWEMKKQEKGIIYDWDGFQNRFGIEYKQIRHRNGMAEYLDKHGRVVLVRPKTGYAVDKLTKIMDEQLN